MPACYYVVYVLFCLSIAHPALMRRRDLPLPDPDVSQPNLKMSEDGLMSYVSMYCIVHDSI